MSDDFEIAVPDADGDGDGADEEFEVEFRSTPFRSFADVTGRREQKEKLERFVVDAAGYDDYGTRCALVLGEGTHGDVERRLAEALSGELDGDYSYCRVSMLDDVFAPSEYLEAVFEAAREREPSLVVLECVDEFGFDAAEVATVEAELDEVRATGSRVLVVLTAEDEYSCLAEYGHLFDVTVRVPPPDEACRREAVADLLREARERGATATPVADVDVDRVVRATAGRALPHLRTVVTRAVQRRRQAVDGGGAVPLDADALVAAAEELADEQPNETDTDLFGVGGSDTETTAATVPDVSFDDIGGLTEEKRRVREKVVTPIEYGAAFEEAGYSVGQGILLYGPPGNGKTMLAKAVASETDHHFVPVKGPELERPFFGESEEQVRQVFAEARAQAPSVVFFDEFDAIAPARDDVQSPKRDVVNMLLSEMDGLDPLDEVVVMAATNRLADLDRAAVRSGRFDTHVEVTPPTPAEQREIFAVHAADLPLAEGVTRSWLGTLTAEGFSGADVAAVCRTAFELSVRAAEREGRDDVETTREHFRTARRRVLDRARSADGSDGAPGYQ